MPLTKGKKDLTLTAAKTSTRLQIQGVSEKPADGFLEGRMAYCGCGCGEIFKPTRSDQRFIADHRHRGYRSHACATCGLVHRIKGQ